MTMHPVRGSRAARSCSLALFPVLSFIVSLALSGFFPGAASARTNPLNGVDLARKGLARTDRVVVKFDESSEIRLREGRLLSARSNLDLTPLQDWLAQHPGVVVRRHFARSEAELDESRRTGQRQSGRALADLNLYYQFLLPAGGVEEAAAAVASLSALPVVQTAFLEPIPQPAAIDLQPIRPDAATTTPDYQALQGYLGPSPSGINAQAVWGFPGGRGATVKLIDIEGAWLWTHEDLPAPFFQGGTPIADPGWRNHGTAVMGVMAGRNNSLGVVGIASDMQVGSVSIGDLSVAAALDLASANLLPGDIFLIELHSPGPNSNGSGQFGFIPMESWQDNFDAIQTAVANGRICTEAAGNGEQDLDDPVYQGIFDRNVRDSGAVLVGAGTPTGNTAEWFTNYGSRVDLNGWGSSVVTTGYGDLQGGPEDQWYTSFFNGTSSASPVVSGAVASLQGMSKAHWGITLSGPLAARILSQTGTPYVGPKRIGNRPNLVAARQLLLQGVGAIAGTVRDASTGAPVVDALVTLIGSGAVRTDEAGAYSLALLSGSHTIRVEDFYHATAQQGAQVNPGATLTLNISLQPAPTGALSGAVLAENGTPLPGARVRVLDTPLPEAVAFTNGIYSIQRIPAGSYGALYGLVAGKGAAYREFTVSGGRTALVNPILVNAETFESSNGGFVSQNPWAWGTPSVVGPPTAFSGTKLWGTNLSGNYGNDQVAYLTSPVRDFSGASRLFLTFTHWYDTEADYDGGNVQVRVGSNWVTIEPYGGYPVNFLAGLDWEEGYSGQSSGWQPAVFDLTSYISSTVQVRFHFGSDGGVAGPGWYIDDVAFDRVTVPADVAEGGPPSASLSWSRPNPFSASTSIAFRLDRPAAADLDVYETSGRLVRRLLHSTLPAGEHAVSWDGTDDAGHSVASGAYFYTLRVDGRNAETRRVLRLR